jgi:hypothetical protein
VRAGQGNQAGDAVANAVVDSMVHEDAWAGRRFGGDLLPRGSLAGRFRIAFPGE